MIFSHLYLHFSEPFHFISLLICFAHIIPLKFVQLRKAKDWRKKTMAIGIWKKYHLTISCTRSSNKIPMGKSNSGRKELADQRRRLKSVTTMASYLSGSSPRKDNYRRTNYANLCVAKGLSVKQKKRLKQNTSIFVDGTWFGAFAVAAVKWRHQQQHATAPIMSTSKRGRATPTIHRPTLSLTGTLRKIRQ